MHLGAQSAKDQRPPHLMGQQSIGAVDVDPLLIVRQVAICPVIFPVGLLFLLPAPWRLFPPPPPPPDVA